MELVGAVARKRGDADRLAVEAAVTSRAAQLGERCGLFHVPSVVRLDRSAGLLETARVDGLRTLMELAVGGASHVGPLCERLGAATATVHAQLALEPEWCREVPPDLADASVRQVVLHGDLTASNVGWTPDDRLVILDWSAAPSIPRPATVGPPQFDLLWFSTFFFRTRPLGRLAGWRPEEWTGAFLDGYARAGGDADAGRLLRYAERVRPFLEADYAAELARRARGVRRLPYRAWRALGWRRWRRFLVARASQGTSGASA